MHALLLALALATAQSDDWDDQADAGERARRLSLAAWGGQGFDLGYEHRGNPPVAGGELAYAFGFGDLGVAGYGYRLRNTTARWTPVALVRLTNHFPTRRGLDATFGLGLGAARPDGWIPWYQVALGARLDLGALWIGGELSFEQYELLRIAGGVGVAF